MNHALDDTVAVWADAAGTTHDHQPYSNSYVFVFEMSAHRITRVTEFLDMAACLRRGVGPRRGPIRQTVPEGETHQMPNVNAETTALIVIDLQDGILSPDPIPFGRDQIVDRRRAPGTHLRRRGVLGCRWCR